jgi:hypothetical protein
MATLDLTPEEAAQLHDFFVSDAVFFAAYMGSKHAWSPEQCQTFMERLADASVPAVQPS